MIHTKKRKKKKKRVSMRLNTPYVWRFLRFQPFFFYQRLLHCSWDMNNAPRHMNYNRRMNNNFFIIIIYYFQFLIFNKISYIQTDTKYHKNEYQNE